MKPKAKKLVASGVKIVAAAASSKTEISLKPPSPSRQIGFHQLLVAARKKYFRDALSEALSTLDPNLVKAQIAQYVPAEAQQSLAAAGIRDEYAFPVPAVIEAKPTACFWVRHRRVSTRAQLAWAVSKVWKNWAR